MTDDLDDGVVCLRTSRIDADPSMSTRCADASPRLDESLLVPEGGLPLEVVQPSTAGGRIEADEGQPDLKRGQDIQREEFRLLPGQCRVHGESMTVQKAPRQGGWSAPTRPTLLSSTSTCARYAS